MICGMPLLLHAAHIQTHTHIVSGFFVNPKYFQSHSFGAFSFHSKWWKKNWIDNKEIDAQLLHKNKRVCFRAEHSEMHRTWMIPIEQQKENEKKNRFGCVGFSVGFVRLMCHLVRQPNIDTFNNKKYKYICRWQLIPHFEQVISSSHRSAAPSNDSSFLPESPENRFNVHTLTHTHTCNQTTNIYDFYL